MHNALISRLIVAHPFEYRHGRLALWRNDDQSHLPIHRYEGLIHHNLPTTSVSYAIHQ